MNFRVTALAILCLAGLMTFVGVPRLVGSAAAPPDYQRGPILLYQGRFVEESAYRELADRLPRVLDQAMQRAATAVGWSAGPPPCRLRLVDDASGFAWTEQFVARTVTGTRGPAVIALRLEPLLAGRVELEATLTHEATHAVLARAIGPAYARIPEWLREGIAVDAAGETEINLSRAISLTRLRPVEMIADGLSRTRHATSDYGESGLAIETLRTLAGEDAVPRLVSCLASEGEWAPCLQELTGLRFKQFEARAMIDALEAVGEMAGDRVVRWESARARLRTGDPAAALAALESLLGPGRGPFDREARLESARALALLDRPHEALGQTEMLLRMSDYGPELGVEALVLEAELSRRAGLPARADEVCRKLQLYYAREEGDRGAECADSGLFRISDRRPSDRSGRDRTERR